MNLFEQWTGVSPDGGNGTTELLFLATILFIVVMVIIKCGFRKRDDTASHSERIVDSRA